MIELYYGGDFDKTRNAARASIAAHSAGDATVVHIDSNNFSPSALDECIGSQGLFFSKLVVDLKDVCDLAERKEIVLERLNEMAASPNIFVWSERSLDAKSLTEAKKHVSSFKDFPAKAKPRPEAPIVFDFAAAVALKDKKKAWSLYAQFVREESSPEEVCGTLAWQFKMIVLAHVCMTADEAGVSPYAFQNAKRIATKVSKAEALARLRDIVSMYHEAHRGRVNLDAAIERFALA